MSPTFTEDDVGKRVETSDGDALGVVVAIDRETAYVEPDPNAADSSRAALDWGDAEEAVPLADEAVDEVTDEAIRLEGGFREGSLELESEPGAEGDATGAESTDAGRERGEFAPGEPVAEPGSETDPDADVTDSDVERNDPEPTGPDPGAEVDLDEGLAGAPGSDPAEEIDGDAERGVKGGLDQTEEGTAQRELEAVEDEASRELEVDPSELTEGEPEAELEPGEDVGQRTETGREPGGSRDRGPTTEDGGASETEGNDERLSEDDE